CTFPYFKHILLDGGVNVRETTFCLPCSPWDADCQFASRDMRSGSGARLHGHVSLQEAVSSAWRFLVCGQGRRFCSSFSISDLTGWKVSCGLSSTNRNSLYSLLQPHLTNWRNFQSPPQCSRGHTDEAQGLRAETSAAGCPRDPTCSQETGHLDLGHWADLRDPVPSPLRAQDHPSA
ncbi:unnamed protein product, partial [Gulo gulo]